MGDSYYWVWHQDDPRLGIATRLVPDIPGFEFVRRLRSIEPITEWKQLEFRLKEGEMYDLLWERSGAPALCSERLKAILDRHRGPWDRFEWIPATVFDRRGTNHPAALLHFLERPLSSSPDPSSAPLASSPDDLVPEVIRDRLAGRKIVAHPDHYARPFLVSAEVKADTERSGCVGLDFVQAVISRG